MASPQYTAEDLYGASSSKNWEKVRHIIRAKPQLVNERYGDEPLLWIIIMDYKPPQNVVLQMLQFAKRNAVDYVEKELNTSILHRLAIGYAEALRRALEISTKRVNSKSSYFGQTPLHYLLRADDSFLTHRDAAQALIDAGADSDTKDVFGDTPVDVYTRNRCKSYDASKREKQKEHIVQLLNRMKIIPVEILARGAEALKAFNEGREEGEVEVNQGRNIFMGLERVGKSSTINSFLRKDFNLGEEITDALATTKVCTQDAVDETLWKETSHDHFGVAGIYENALVEAMTKHALEEEEQKADEATAGPTGIKHVFTTMKQSVELSMNVLLSKFKREEKTLAGRKQEYEVAEGQEKEPYVERKHESAQKRLTEEIPENLASKVEERMNEIKFTTEATSEWRKSGNDFIMNIWDFGGQPIYHVIQRIFLVSFAVVCVVFNLEDDLDSPAYVRDPTTGKMYKHRMTNLQFILYWIRSVFTNSRDLKLDDGQLSPPVLLIGTHLHSLEGNGEEKKKKAEEIFSQIRQALEGKPYEAMVFSTFFAIENSLPFSKSNASNIMNQILKFAKKMVRTLPLTWLLVQQEIQKLKEKYIYLPTIEVIALVDRCGVKYDAVRVLLEYLHDLGEILYFPDDKTLMDIIVLDLKRIVDMFKTIITVIDPKLRGPLLKEAWRKLDSGILEERLLRHLWKKFNVSDETFDFFVSLMQKFGLVCERKTTRGDGRIFYVLSRLKPQHVDSSPAEDYGKRAVSIFHDFGGYLPDDVFQRGVTKFIERFQIEDSEPTLAYEHVELDIDELHHVVLDVANLRHRRMFQTTIIRRKILNTNAEDEPLSSVCKEVLSFLEAELKIFCQSGGRGVELRMYIPCVCSPNIRDAHMHVVRKFDKDVLPCGSNGMEVTRYRRLFGDNSQQQALPLSQPAVTKPVGFVDDAIIATVSEEMNLSWRRFGVRLGLTWSKINTFLADEQLKEKAIASMMTYWRSSIGSERHQLKVLCSVLRQHRLDSLAGKLTQGMYSQSDLDDETLNITIHKECFGDQDLLFICGHIGPGWRRLAVRLGLDWYKVSEIAHNNRLMEDGIMEVLVTWRDGQSTNQVPTMINALRQHGCVHLAERVCERHDYKDEFEVAATQVHLPQVSTQRKLVQECFGDQDLLFMCGHMAPGWRRLAVRLGLDWNKISEIAHNNRLMEDGIMEALVTWRDGQSTNQVLTMVNALKHQGLVQLAERVCERHGYKDEFEVAATQVHLPQVLTQRKIVQGYLQDADLLFLSEMIGRGWKDVVRSLGIEDPEVDEVDVKFQGQMVEATLEILFRWRNRQKSNVNQLREVKAALNVIGRKFTAEKLDEYYQQK